MSLTSLTGKKLPSHACNAKSLSKKSFPSSVFTNACLNIPFAFQNFLKWIIFSILKNKEKSKIYKLYFKGFLNSLLNKKSFYRAEID